MDLSGLMDEIEDITNDIENLNNNWSIEIELADLEPCIKIDLKRLFELIYDDNEERFGEDFDDSDELKIKNCLRESIDFDKLNDLMPKYYYPNGETLTITKQDLIDYKNK